MSFLRTEAFYTIKRLLAADQKDLYDRHFNPYVPEADLSLDSAWNIVRNSRKGGVSLTSYLTYGWYDIKSYCVTDRLHDTEANA